MMYVHSSVDDAQHTSRPSFCAPLDRDIQLQRRRKGIAERVRRAGVAPGMFTALWWWCGSASKTGQQHLVQPGVNLSLHIFFFRGVCLCLFLGELDEDKSAAAASPSPPAPDTHNACVVL